VAGEPPAIRQVERWAWSVLAFRRFGFSREECEDVVQETLAALWRDASREGFKLRRDFRAFVRRVAAARAIDRLRRRRPLSALDESLVDPNLGPYDELLRRDERARLHWSVQQLDPKCRDLIKLHLEEDRPYAEIAAAEGRSESTLRVRMFNCLRTLRRLVARFE
jgi:RNA polymerase sigma factor (sigma-70 family)